ncbi:2-oxoacid:ferredoxin oxidoreductase subunit beta [Candidatus Micrarchaeota archaeon]|nr:2-oxoacid:ferredoxin oxidoreductase subunit beta [Candidatus Micrarchaeota archaeon]MBU2477178.1 2-oxoacid:ferredoxin oxidoreductase subunit beta [Candidatus Micrarchaeota archaeon]
MTEINELNTKELTTWCPGCGNHLILAALKKAVSKMNLNPSEVAVVSGIGCSSGLPHWIETYGFHSIHGRAVPVATGVKLANHNLNVFVVSGDGDGYGIGLNHLIHAMRRNLDITFLGHDNQIYGLTLGQTSPTSEQGAKTVSTPNGSIELPINPIALGLASGATFIARAFAGNTEQLADLIVKGTQHEGFALIDILQPCVTLNKVNTFEFFQKRVYDLQSEKHDTSNFSAAFLKSFEWNPRIPTGIFYQTKRDTYTEDLPQLKEKSLVKQQQELKSVDINSLLEKYK